MDLLAADTSTVKIRALYGFSDRIEFGASLSAGDTDGGSVTAKYRVTDGQSNFDLAVGGSLTFAEKSRGTNVADVYLMGTQAFTSTIESRNPILGTVGVHFIEQSSVNTIQPFIGAEIPLENYSQLVAEYQFKDTRLFHSPLSSAALRRHQFTPAWSGQLGLTNATGYYNSTHKYHIFVGTQFAFNFGQKR